MNYTVATHGLPIHETSWQCGAFLWGNLPSTWATRVEVWGKSADWIPHYVTKQQETTGFKGRLCQGLDNVLYSQVSGDWDKAAAFEINLHLERS